MRRIEADANRSADTHLHAFPLPEEWGIDLYLKDESMHPDRILKHRLARSLFLYGLCNGWIDEGTTIVEASSGSTAVSEAYFARLLGLPFIAVMPASTCPEKIALIEFHGGGVPPRRRPHHRLRRGARLAATDRRALHGPVHLRRAGHRLARQQQHRRVDLRRRWRWSAIPIPQWIVVGAGTGGTSATIGRYVRYRRHRHAAVRGRPRGLGVLRYSARSGDPQTAPGGPRGSRASAGRGSSRRSSRPSSTG